MNIKGIDRVVLGVRDMDSARDLFSRVFGMEFVELNGPQFEEAGVRICIDLDHHMELLSPILPAKDVNPPDTRKLAELLDEQGDGVLFALALKVDDAEAAAAEAQSRGIGITAKIEQEQVEALSIRNFKEVILDDKDTLGVKIALVEWDS